MTVPRMQRSSDDGGVDGAVSTLRGPLGRPQERAS